MSASGVKRTFKMLKIKILKGRSREEAAIELDQVATSQAGIQDLYDYMVLAYSTYR